MTQAAPKAIAITKVLEQVMRDDRGRLLAALTARLRDLQLAEDVLQEAMISAMSHWGRAGVPNSPQGWLLRVSLRKAIDRFRGTKRSAKQMEDLAILAQDEAFEFEGDEIPDERLRLIFTCCHPALEQKTQIALTLRSVCGLSTTEVAASFLDNDVAMGQRLSRAKAKIAQAGIPFRVPEPAEWDERLKGVLKVLSLIFTQGYKRGPVLGRDLCEEALYLTRVTQNLKPDDPEIRGCLALMMFTAARAPARRDEMGRLVRLTEQDRSKWDWSQIAAGRDLLQGQPLGSFTLQAAISEAHLAEGGSNWQRIAKLYGLLAEVDGNRVLLVNLAVAICEAHGPESAKTLIDGLTDLEGYQPFHAARAEIFRQLHRIEDAKADYLMAIKLAENQEDADFLTRQMASLAN